MVVALLLHEVERTDQSASIITLLAVFTMRAFICLTTAALMMLQCPWDTRLRQW